MEPPGAATFRVCSGANFFVGRSQELEPPFLAASFWQAKKESLDVVTKHDLRAIYNINVIQKRLALIINFLRAQN